MHPCRNSLASLVGNTRADHRFVSNLNFPKSLTMPTITVIPVQSGSQRKQFLELPWQLYRDDPNWIPPLRDNQKELVGYKKHPFYKRNEIQTFLALRDGQPCGRIAAIADHTYMERFDDPRGYFGFFESIDDQEVASQLLGAVRDWHAERGRVDFRGPMNPSMNYECGLLVDGFHAPPFFMMTYNHPYYGKLIEDFGCRKVQDMYAFSAATEMLKSLDKKLGFIAEESKKRLGATIRRLDKSRFKDELRMFLRIYNESLGGMWSFTPLSDEEIEHMGASLRLLIVPELTKVIEIEGRPVATSFTLLDYNPRIKRIDGRLFPLGFLRLLWNRKAIKNMRLISTNVLPEYQRWGLGLVLMDAQVPDVLAWGIQEAEFSWVLESNHLSYKTLKRGGAKISKTYRFYDYGPHPDKHLKQLERNHATTPDSPMVEAT